MTLGKRFIGYYSVALLVCLILARSANAMQLASSYTTTSSSGKSSAPSSPEDRSLAAIDLAVLAAESGIYDVSFEAVRRAVGSGPPVKAIDLGGLLSANSTRARNPSERNALANPQAKTALRLAKVNQVWLDSDVSKEACYELWKNIVFPPERPSEAFAYSSAPGNSSFSYSIDLKMKKPEEIASGAKMLVLWAVKADRLADLKSTMETRSAHPSAQATVKLLSTLVAANDESIDKDSLCDEISKTPELLVSGPEKELLMSSAYELLNSMPTESKSRQQLWDAIAGTCRTTERWGANAWLKYAVIQAVVRAIESNDAESFDSSSEIALTILKPLSNGNEDYKASVTAGFYGSASDIAFKANHLELGIECMKRQALSRSTRSTGRSQLVTPNTNISKNLIKLEAAKRYEALSELVWNMPVLGLASAAQVAPDEQIPENYINNYKNYRKTDKLPFESITTRTSGSFSLLEWVMRDALELGKEAEIEDQLATLKEAKSDDLPLAKLVWSKVRNGELDLDLVLEEDSEGKQRLRKEVTGRGNWLPLDVEIASSAIESEETRELGADLASRLAERGIANRSNDILYGRMLVARAKLLGDSNASSQRDLKHFVVANDYSGGEILNGLPAEALWMEKETGTWEHIGCTSRSSLLLKYPLAGKFEISFSASDNTYAESACTVSGLQLDFRGYLKDVALELMGSRSATNTKFEEIKGGGEFNDFTLRCDSKAGTVQLLSGEEDIATFELGEGEFPFFGLHSMMHRNAVVKDLKISGDITIPDSLELLTPNLCGWSARFRAQRLPPVAYTEGQREALEDAEKPKLVDLPYDWHLVDNQLESVDHAKLQAIDEANGEEVRKPTYPRRESWIYYMRPLCDQEKLTFEFFHEDGKYSASPTIDRTAVSCNHNPMRRHWITTAGGAWFGVNSTNRVNIPPKLTLGDPQLKEGQWNSGSFRRDGTSIIISINGTDVYKQDVTASLGGRVGFFHDPTLTKVKLRNVELTGDWPSELPDDLFEKITSK